MGLTALRQTEEGAPSGGPAEDGKKKGPGSERAQPRTQNGGDTEYQPRGGRPAEAGVSLLQFWEAYSIRWRPRADGCEPREVLELQQIKPSAPYDGGRTHGPEPSVRTLERRHTAARGGIRCATGLRVLKQKTRTAEKKSTGL